MEIVNAIAEALAADPNAPPIAYLAYHDTIEPHPGLKPLANVWFEWAPRERCYSHAIDDPACEINPRYFESLKRYLDIFNGRGHVFEYYADAILFCGLGFATPAIVASDLRAYRAPGHHEHFEPDLRRLQRDGLSREPRSIRPRLTRSRFRSRRGPG